MRRLYQILQFVNPTFSLKGVEKEESAGEKTENAPAESKQEDEEGTVSFLLSLKASPYSKIYTCAFILWDDAMGINCGSFWVTGVKKSVHIYIRKDNRNGSHKEK